MGIKREQVAANGTTQSLRVFETGATRDLDLNKLDYEGFLSPIALERYAQYMNKNRLQKDGTLRGSDNWQLGMPLDVYMKSMWRHFFDVWKAHDGVAGAPPIDESLAAMFFNVQGYLHETMKGKK